MDQASIIGIDLAKHSFQVHGARADGSVAFRKKLSRGKVLDFLASQPPCVVAMEACGSAHHWGREAEKLGHEVKLVPPIYVKPFVKRQKNDMADAEATTEAAQRPTMSFVAVKTEEQQARGMLFRTRDLLVRQRTQTINALRGHLAEFGVIAPQGPAHVSRLASALEDPCSGLPEQVRELAGLLLEQIAGLDEKIRGLEKDVHTSARQDEEAVRLMTIPGVGPITAMALQAFAPPMESFRRGRDFSAWLGLVPRQHTTGGKPRLGQDIQDGPARPQAASDHGRDVGRTERRPTWRDDGPLAGQYAGAQAEDARCSCAGQQNGAHHPGADDEEGELPGSRHRLRGRSAGSRRGCEKVGGQVRANGQMRRDRENQLLDRSSQARVPDLDPFRVSPYRPAASNRSHQQAE